MIVVLLTCSRMLLQSAEIVVKKFLVDYKIIACVKEISPPFRIGKHCLVKHFALLENVCYQLIAK